ncbi:MAG: hypothetical protein N2511_06660 [Thermodesulfovibrionales bacterium]|nr:hypothetical protein [Thermodesulfovibrionales bacterium]
MKVLLLLMIHLKSSLRVLISSLYKSFVNLSIPKLADKVITLKASLKLSFLSIFGYAFSEKDLAKKLRFGGILCCL